MEMGAYWSEDVEKVYNSVIESTGENLKGYLVECLLGYNQSLKEPKGENRDYFLMWYKTFYNIARDRAKDIGMDVLFFSENLEVLSN